MYDSPHYNIPFTVGPVFTTFGQVVAQADANGTGSMADGVGDRVAFFRKVKLTHFGVMTHGAQTMGSSEKGDVELTVYLGTGTNPVGHAVCSCVLDTKAAKQWVSGGVGISTVASDALLKPFVVVPCDGTEATSDAFGISYFLGYQERW